MSAINEAQAWLDGEADFDDAEGAYLRSCGIIRALLEQNNALLARVEAGTVYGNWQVGEETLKTHVNIGINVWRGDKWMSFHQASPAEFVASLDACRKTTEVRPLLDDAAIDAARQPA